MRLDSVSNHDPEYSLETASGPMGRRIAKLQRKAGRYQDKDWKVALICLREAAELMRYHPSNYPLEWWFRLPMALQAAGLFEAAIDEFHQILDETDGRLNNEFSHQKSKIWKKFVHLNYFQIYEEMTLACQLQKLDNRSQQYALLAAQHYQIFLDMSADAFHYKLTRESVDTQNT